MAQFKEQTEIIEDYIDFVYQGYLFSSEDILVEEIRFSYQQFISSLSQYPLGSIIELYPIGSLIPLLGFNDGKMKIKIKWKVGTGGTLSLVFYNKLKEKILNSGISTTSDVWNATNTITYIPKEAFYIVLINDNAKLAEIEYIEFYTIKSVYNSTSKILLRNAEAIKNSFKMWLFSQKGDYGRKITKGGVLDWLLNKRINDITSQEIKDTLRNEIRSQFFDIDIADIVVEPALEEQKYKVTIYIRDDYNKLIIPVTLSIQ